MLGPFGRLKRERIRAQHFRSWACPIGTASIGAATGLPGRHLDHWLMPADVCRAVFARGSRHGDVAVVEGTLQNEKLVADRRHQTRPGDLEEIAETLDLPTIAIVPCQGWSGLHLPELPKRVDALILDGLEDADEFPALKPIVELITRRPVVGALESLPKLREALLGLPLDQVPPADLLARLAAGFNRFADWNALRELSESRSFPETCSREPAHGPRRFRVAYAQDEAFGGYFPDTLETLETLGADLVEFSPLRDEALPEGVDLAIIGCGFPDRHAAELSRNHSLMNALRVHVCRGRRLYAEGGGMAYLGRSLILENGRRYPTAGILPFDAELRDHPTGPTPVTRELTRDCWLGHAGLTIRGYRCGRWRLHPAPDILGCPAASGVLTGAPTCISITKPSAASFTFTSPLSPKSSPPSSALLARCCQVGRKAGSKMDQYASPSMPSSVSCDTRF